jgi:hypothetical protein
VYLTSEMEKSLRSYVEVVKKNIKEIVPSCRVKQFGIRKKSVAGKFQDDVCIAFFVRQKLRLNELKQYGAEPIPPEIDGIKTDVVCKPLGFGIRIATLQATLPDDVRHRPYSGGVATINSNAFPAGTGTLGLVVRKKSGDTSGNLYGITNNHVGARESTTVNPIAQKGDPWIQPGAHGSGQDPTDRIAALYEWKDMIPSGMGENYFDFALGEITSESKKEAKLNEVMEIGRVEGIAGVTLDDRVIKRGRTTRKRLGKVVGLGLGNIQIAYQENTVCSFDDQIEVVGVPETKEFSLGGDSGSIVCTESSPHSVIGLLFAGGPDSNGIDTTIVSPIKRIVDEFNLEI